MRRVLFGLLACAVVVGAVLWVALLPGSVRFEAGTLAVDAATPVVVFAGLLVLAVLYLAVRALAWLVRLPRRMRLARAMRRRRDGDRAVTRALVALAAGHQSDAVAEANRARKLLGETPQTLLLSAQAHGLAGREAEAAAHFGTLAAHPDAALVGLRGLLDQAVARQDWAAAEQLAERAERVYPNSAWLRAERGKIAARGTSLIQDQGRSRPAG
jgi:HemY protein